MLRWKHSQYTVFSVISVSCLLISLAVFLFGAVSVHAQAPGDTFGVTQFEDTVALGGDDIRVVVARIIRVALGLLGIITLSIIIYGGFVYMTSQGQEDKIAQAKKILINATIGLAIIMSSFAITQFFINAFGKATGIFGPGGGRAGGPIFENFAGSGALGSGIIKDHYPMRDEHDVKRNTSIFVTFGDPMDPSSMIENSNASCWTDDGQSTADPALCDPDGNGIVEEANRPYYGDCIAVPGQPFDRREHCDHMRTDTVHIVEAEKQNQDPVPSVEGSGLASYEDGDDRNAYTFSFKPFVALGSDVQAVDYVVDLTQGIQKADKTGAFAGEIYNHYAWIFDTGTEFDFDPPFVTYVSPGLPPNEVAPRNSIIQITFSEPMDITSQGVSGPNTSFNNVIFRDSSVTGEWRLSNNYRTLEFLSDIACGQNSCGQTTYCLPTPSCEPGQAACAEEYEVLIRTARPIDEESGSFEAVPFTGFMDSAGNALNGRSGRILDHDANQSDGKPPLDQDADGNVLFKTIGVNERNEDNVWFSFGVQNVVDRTPPHIVSVTPDIDTSRVPGDSPLVITFSEAMWYATLRNISLEEYPANVNGLDDVWFMPRSSEDNDNRTQTTVGHRVFGPNGLDLYYFPAVSSDVKDARQNCLYPGRGPVEAETDCRVDAEGNYANCVLVNENPGTDTACVTAHHDNVLLQPDIAACKALLRQPDIGPVNPQPAPQNNVAEQNAPPVAGAPQAPDPAQDRDADGVANAQDNCIDIANPNQKDSDEDGIGEVCDGVVDILPGAVFQ